MATKTKAIEDRLNAIEKKVGIEKTTRILVVQDRSGSMNSRIKETIGGYNEYIEDLAADDSDEAFLTLIQFNTTYEVIEESTPVSDLEPLTTKTYNPSGGTALLDAVGRGITDLKEEMEPGDRALVVIMTDGMENRSEEYTSDSIKKLIKGCEKKGNWTFLFLGAGQDAWTGGDLLGVRRNQAAFYGADSFSHKTAYSGLTQTSRSLRSGSENSMVAPGAEVTATMDSLGADVKVEPKEKNTSGNES